MKNDMSNDTDTIRTHIIDMLGRITSQKTLRRIYYFVAALYNMES